MTANRLTTAQDHFTALQRSVRIVAGLAVLACAAPLQAAPAPTPEEALAAAKGTFREWVEVLGLPNDAVVPADIQRNVA